MIRGGRGASEGQGPSILYVDCSLRHAAERQEAELAIAGGAR